MIFDPIVALGTFSIALLLFPVSPSLDPGPDSACPRDMRLVVGTHAETMEHLCTELVDGHCFAYEDGVSAEEGARLEINVCMDMFEAPDKRGRRPFVMRSFEDARRSCERRDRRVCKEEEWEQACEGAEHRPFAYGWRVDTRLCNSDKQWRPFDVTKLGNQGDDQKAELEKLWQGAPSGEYMTCVSPYGVFDMMGNVEEWVESRSWRRRRGALMGGFWAKPWTGCRGTNDAHEENFEFYETGFRCCAEPNTLDEDGRPLGRTHAP